MDGSRQELGARTLESGKAGCEEDEARRDRREQKGDKGGGDDLGTCDIDVVGSLEEGPRDLDIFVELGVISSAYRIQGQSQYTR